MSFTMQATHYFKWTPRGVCGDMTSQQLHAVFGSQQNQELHPALKMVDYGSVGVIGHSMGGAWSMNTATLAANYSIKAAVASHGFSGDAAQRIPSDLPLMLVTGTGDPKAFRMVRLQRYSGSSKDLCECLR